MQVFLGEGVYTVRSRRQAGSGSLQQRRILVQQRAQLGRQRQHGRPKLGRILRYLLLDRSKGAAGRRVDDAGANQRNFYRELYRNMVYGALD